MNKIMRPAYRKMFSKNLSVRFISSVAVFFPAIVFVVLGDVYIIAFVVFLAGMMSWEIAKTILANEKLIFIGLSIFVSIISVVVFGTHFGDKIVRITGAIGLFPLLLLIWLLKNPNVAMKLVLGNILIIIPCWCILWLRFSIELNLLLWVLASVIATDVGAYFFGKFIGGKKLAPRISPNKTWAGLLGGIVGSIIVGLVFGFAWIDADLICLAVTGAILAIISQLGDLIESGYKRQYGLKDSSGLIPGHGGVLDRLDGHMAAVTLITLIIVFTDSPFLW